MNRSLRSLLAVHGHKRGEDTKVTVVYQDAGSGLQAAADAFKSSGVFDRVADELRHKYSLRQSIAFNAKRCGEANAFYDPEPLEVIFCYELMQDYMDLYSSSIEPETPSISSGKTKAKLPKSKR